MGWEEGGKGRHGRAPRVRVPSCLPSRDSFRLLLPTTHQNTAPKRHCCLKVKLVPGYGTALPSCFFFGRVPGGLDTWVSASLIPTCGLTMDTSCRQLAMKNNYAVVPLSHGVQSI
jgi:hypothetical protein